MSKLEIKQSQNIHDPIKEADQDVLGRQILARTIFERVSESDTEVFGIYGGWGTGKTSLLELMRGLCTAESLQPGKKKVHLEIIDAWKYEGAGNLLIPIIVKLRELSGKDEFLECWKVVAKRVVALTGASLLNMALKTTATSIADIDELYEKIKAKEDKNYETVLLGWERMVDDLTQEQEAFKQIVQLANAALRSDRIILCIDNLDRCTPDKVITLLESIKLFLSVRNCVWIFAMDAEVVANYINRKYDGTSMDGYSYLDKIIPEQYHLALSPVADGRNILHLLQTAAGGSFSDFDERNIPQIPKVLAPRRLIKSAQKVSDFLRSQYAGSASFAIVFHLTLLYHTWPDFYQRISSTSEEHVCGMLEHFFSPGQNPPAYDANTHPLPRAAIPLDKKYTEDYDLSQFLQTAFKDYGHLENKRFVRELIDGMTGLRLTGLP